MTRAKAIGRAADRLRLRKIAARAATPQPHRLIVIGDLGHFTVDRRDFAGFDDEAIRAGLSVPAVATKGRGK